MLLTKIEGLFAIIVATIGIHAITTGFADSAKRTLRERIDRDHPKQVHQDIAHSAKYPLSSSLELNLHKSHSQQLHSTRHLD